MYKKWRSLFCFFAIIIMVQAIGASSTFSSVQSWYPGLHKPVWNPPSWVFGPVWTILYAFIAIAGWRVWRRLEGATRTRLTHPAMRIWIIQLLINCLWSVLFFGFQQPFWALVDISLLLIAIALTIHHFRPLDRPAATLLAPYLLWVLYAFSLNAMICYLN